MYNDLPQYELCNSSRFGVKNAYTRLLIHFNCKRGN